MSTDSALARVVAARHVLRILRGGYLGAYLPAREGGPFSELPPEATDLMRERARRLTEAAEAEARIVALLESIVMGPTAPPPEE